MIKREYKGHIIEVNRARYLGGWDMLYYDIYHIKDGYECTSGYTEDTSTEQEYVGYMEKRIDAELQEPNSWGEHDETNL